MKRKTLHGQSTQHDIEQYRDVGASTHAGSSPMNAGHEPESKRHRKDEEPKLRSKKRVKKRKKPKTKELHISVLGQDQFISKIGTRSCCRRDSYRGRLGARKGSVHLVDNMFLGNAP